MMLLKKDVAGGPADTIIIRQEFIDYVKLPILGLLQGELVGKLTHLMA